MIIAIRISIAGNLTGLWLALESPRYWYDTEQMSNPITIMGIVKSNTRRRPIRSIIIIAIIVKMKLVIATDKDVKVGEEKPIVEKIVAEKYIREF